MSKMEGDVHDTGNSGEFPKDCIFLGILGNCEEQRTFVNAGSATSKWAAAPGNAVAWAPASSQKKTWAENAAAQAPAPRIAAYNTSSWPAKPPAPARKQPGSHVKAPGGKEALPSDYVPESIR